MTEYHDATDADVRPGRVNVISWTRDVASTHTPESGWVVWHASDVHCCAGQRGWWDTDLPGVWDTSGVGTWAAIDTVQCGGCGSRVGPVSALVVGAGNDEGLADAIADVERRSIS